MLFARDGTIILYIFYWQTWEIENICVFLPLHTYIIYNEASTIITYHLAAAYGAGSEEEACGGGNGDFDGHYTPGALQ